MPDPILNHFTVNLRDGSTVDLPLPSHRDMATILSNLRAAQRKQLIANLADTGLPGEQRFVELSRFDAQPPYKTDKFIDYFNTPEGANEIFLYVAQKKMNRADAEKMLDNLVDAPRGILAPLFGLSFSAPSPEADETEVPLPPADPPEATQP